MITNAGKRSSAAQQSYYSEAPAVVRTEAKPAGKVVSLERKRTVSRAKPAYRISRAFVYQVMALAITAAVMSILVVRGYERISETGIKVAELQSAISSLDQDAQSLQTTLDCAVDTATLQKKASIDLNMSKPGADRLIEVDFSANVAAPEKIENSGAVPVGLIRPTVNPGAALRSGPESSAGSVAESAFINGQWEELSESGITGEAQAIADETQGEEALNLN